MQAIATKATIVAQAQPVANAPVVTVTQPTTLRTARVAKVQVLLHAKHIAAKQAKYVAAKQAANNAAYQAAVALLQQQFGVTVAPHAPASVRTSNGSSTVPHAPKSGVTQQVWLIAAQHNYVRKATLQACAAAGINPATAATQYALAKKANMQAA